LWQVDYGVNLIKYNWNQYIGLRDVNTFSADNEYNIFDIKTWKKLFDKKIKGKPYWIKIIWDKEVIYTRTYSNNKTRTYLYSKDNWDNIWSKNWYLGEDIITNSKDLLEKPVWDSNKKEFIEKILAKNDMFLIDSSYGSDYISIFDSKSFDKIGDFSTKSGVIEMEDDSMVALKYQENSNNWIIFDINNRKDLSSDFCNTQFSIKDFENYCIFTKVDWNHLVLNKTTKKVVDCMWKVSSDFIYMTNFLLIESSKDSKTTKKLVNIDLGKILSTNKPSEESIEDFYIFRWSNNIISKNVIVKLKNNNGEFVYAYANLVTDINTDWKLVISKKYKKYYREWSDMFLSNGLLSKIKINWHGNKI